MKILVVDDHPLMRDALQGALAGFDGATGICLASTCAEGLALAASDPDLGLLVLDLSLPDVTGFEGLTLFRERFPALPVVVFSAYTDRETIVGALDHGAMGFIPKTSAREVLIEALRRALSGGVTLPDEVMYGPAPGNGLSGPHPTGGTATPADIGLTHRQAQVLALLVQGKPNKIISRELDIAEGTVKIHMTAILHALGVTNRTQAVIMVGRLGLKP